MGWQVVKQPDGRLAVFSSIVDDWIMYDADRDEVIGLFVEAAADRARIEAGHVVDHVEAGTPRNVYYQWTRTFQELDDMAAEHHRGHRLADHRAEHAAQPTSEPLTGPDGQTATVADQVARKAWQALRKVAPATGIRQHGYGPARFDLDMGDGMVVTVEASARRINRPAPDETGV